MSFIQIFGVASAFIGFLSVLTFPLFLSSDEDRTWIWQKRKNKADTTLTKETK